MISKMTDEIQPIKDCKEALKGSFKGIIIKAGDLKSGTKDGKDWSRKIFTIQDGSDTAELVTWGDEIKNFEVGRTYEITNPWWKNHEGKISVTVGNYGTAKVITSDIPDTPEPPKEQTTLQSEPESKGSSPAPKVDSPQVTQSKGRNEDDRIQRLEGDELLAVQKATKTLLAISLAVGEEAGKVTDYPSEIFVMEATKLIYKKFFSPNFTKASDI